MSLNDPNVETSEGDEDREASSQSVSDESTDLVTTDFTEAETDDEHDNEVDLYADDDAGNDSDDNFSELQAVIAFAGKQSVVEVGSFLDAVVATDGELPIDPDPVIDTVLAASLGDKVVIGSPTIEGATVDLESLGTRLGPKTVSFKRRRRKSSSKVTRGGRQYISEFVVTAIDIPDHFSYSIGGMSDSDFEALE